VPQGTAKYFFEKQDALHDYFSKELIPTERLKVLAHEMSLPLWYFLDTFWRPHLCGFSQFKPSLSLPLFPIFSESRKTIGFWRCTCLSSLSLFWYLLLVACISFGQKEQINGFGEPQHFFLDS
jgi:hypothetical protein